MSDRDPAFYRYAPILIGLAAGVLGLVLIVAALSTPTPQLPELVLLGLGVMATVSLVAVAAEGLRRAARHRSAAAVLERRLDDVALFAVAARHDLREPLRKIITFGERLRESLGPVPDAHQDRYAERMSDAAERMQGLLDELSVHSRINDSPLVTETFSTGAELADMVESAGGKLSACGGSVTLGTLPDIAADRAQFRLVAEILLDNAIQYADATRPLAVAFDGMERPDGSVEIRVRDNGIGFDPGHGERIFGPLVRLHSRDAYPGTGIGLATARKIAERHGGQLIAQGESGNGATFTLILPRQKASLSQDDPKSTLQPG